MDDNKQALQVAALKDGTVIDHIPVGKLFIVVSLLGLTKMENNITIGFNLDSKKLGKKGIIKIADKFFCNEDLNRISVIAPSVKLNIIRNYKVVEKKEVKIPDILKGIVKCSNPQCITNHEPMTTLFQVLDKSNGLIKCHYCEKELRMNENNVLI
ncbi:Aspartate carbamoyltransferase regulatory chain [termite gut metagenome]|jgi:aspartate carbamoyltransferase regulatory subunit|uniref:Aspartate carbamoyltransferase regulatory chain n=1 Tax=termite gut metagenome TaxID=433724 RepID=A0A5J4SGK0_9ZZZZ